MALGSGVVLIVLGLVRVDDVAPRLSLVAGEAR
jgi:hypothetical protein